MNKILGVLLMFVLVLGAGCREHKNELTTFILVRHAEKGNDGTEDPDLSAAGEARARRLAFMLKDTPVKAVYSTNFKRTRNTAQPVAETHDVDMQLYEAHKPEVIERILNEHQGETVLVSGHSNNIPWTANLLLGKEVYKDYDESEYGIVLIVSLTGIGSATVTRLNY